MGTPSTPQRPRCKTKTAARRFFVARRKARCCPCGGGPGRTGTSDGTYAFDYGNRLRTAAGLTYRYDAQGRRVRQDSAGTQLKYSFYSQDGKLRWQRDEPAAKRLSHLYLAGSLIAELSRPIGAGTAAYTYQHTDALGSPIARTNSAGGVIETSEYEPYGKLLNRANDDRPGYTGHVMDAASGLTYMQQRYYDPQIGRFLSIDPVTAQGGDQRYFNRYWYAAGNPYKYTDPDGRILDTLADIGFIAYSAYKLATEPSWTNAGALGADIVGAAVPFATGLGAGVRAAAHGAEAARGAGKAAEVGKATRAGHNGVEGPVNQVRSTTRTGEVRVKETFPDGSRKDITADRVKEYVPEPKNPGTGERQVKFPDGEPKTTRWPNDSGKRPPTPEERKSLE
ncbi:MAG TPA: RHS repeat-associated core domain-containing protein [Thermomonas sp.]|nr:RHS repeat-associated core domain-containing protein [Thermomonas sp.]